MKNSYFILIIVIFTLNKSIAGDSTYFQQRVEYDIQVRLDDQNHYLHGSITIRYTNNAQVALDRLKMHLWPNAYSGRNTALCRQLTEDRNTSLYFAKEADRGRMDSLSFYSQGKELQLNSDKENPDIADLILAAPLAPGKTLVISGHFRLKIPSSKFSRLGHNGNAYFISQWYPKPAVFDRHGWHAMPYLNQGEFYSEFGHYKVAITLPSDYVVASTGVLQTPQERDFLNSRAVGDTTNPYQTPLKTITFEQDSIHDFAWFADKQFRVLKREFILPSTGKMITGWVFHTGKRPKLWALAPGYIESGMKFISERVGAYPFSQFSVVDGQVAAGGGMEYPTITLLNTPSSAYSLENVLVHELYHNWFYGMLASNERDYAWMDEGLTSFYENLYVENQYPGGQLKGKSMFANLGIASKALGTGSYTPRDDNELIFKMASCRHRDQPMQLPSAEYTNMNYGAVVYAKSTLALRFLRDYLGDSLFDLCMQSYFEVWKFRHPYPDDMEAVFERVSKKELDWFFHGLLKSTAPEKYRPVAVSGKNWVIRSESPSAIPLKISNGKGQFVWKEGFSDTSVVEIPFEGDGPIAFNREHSILLKGRDRWMNSNGDVVAPQLTNSLFYRVRDSFGTENHMVMPVAGWNHYNGWMAGIHVTNMDLVPEPFEFFLSPLYDFKNKRLAGMVNINYHIWPMTGFFQAITLSGEVKHFSYGINTTHHDTIRGSKPVFTYTRIVPGLNFQFRPSSHRSPIRSGIRLTNVTILKDEIEYTPVAYGYSKSFVTPAFNFTELQFRFANRRLPDPYDLDIALQSGPRHLKLSAEFHYHISYAKKNKGLDMRFFAGGFIFNNEKRRNYNLRMSSWRGRDDYLYEEIYFGRNDSHGFWDNQMVIHDGGFKIPTVVGQTGKWLASINLSADLPLPVPLKFYFDLGTFEGITTIMEGISKSVMYDGGVGVILMKNTLEVYVPLFMSKDIRENLEVNDARFTDRIRFVMNIRNLAPVKLRESIINIF